MKLIQYIESKCFYKYKSWSKNKMQTSYEDKSAQADAVAGIYVTLHYCWNLLLFLGIIAKAPISSLIGIGEGGEGFGLRAADPFGMITVHFDNSTTPAGLPGRRGKK